VNALTANAGQSEYNVINIPPNVKDGLGRLFTAHPVVAKVIVFGSRARGDAEERSDIDLAIVAPTATSRQWLDIVFALEEMDTLLSIDVVRWREASVALKARIIAEGKVFYERRKVTTKSHQS
jgi:predicted nucleotidyltransferase